MRTALARIAYGLAEELAPKGVTALAVTPGFMRTETVLERLEATVANWPMAKRFLLSASETPCFVGRAIAALAADPGVGK